MIENGEEKNTGRRNMRICLLAQALRAKSLPCDSLSSHQERTLQKLTILVFQAILLKGSAEQIIRIDHNIYKIIETHRKSLVHNVGRGVLGEE